MFGEAAADRFPAFNQEQEEEEEEEEETSLRAQRTAEVFLPQSRMKLQGPQERNITLL